MANDFTDPRCVALWRFEDGALETDSKGTNTLTPINTPAADLADFKEGAASVVLTNAANKYFTIADASLDAGFPLKSGDATKKVSYCFWYKVSTNGSWRNIFGKWNVTGNKRSLLVANDNGTLRILLGIDGTTYQTVVPGLTIATNIWYHIAIVIDGVAKTMVVRVWNDTTGAIVLTYSGTFTNALYVTDCAFNIGYDGNYSTTSPDGKYDEFVVFDSLLSATEIDKIRAGTYGVYEYAPAGIPLTLAPDSSYAGPHQYAGNILFRLTPVSATELYDPGEIDAIPASTGGYAMGGEGVWGSSTPTNTDLSAIADAEPTGFYMGGGADPQVVSTMPPADEIIPVGGWSFCGAGASGDATSIMPPSDLIDASVGLRFGGAGVWGQVRPEDIPRATLVGTGGFVLSGSGFALDPAITPTATVIVSTGGWKLGGIRPDPVEVTYPDDLDRVIIPSGGFEFGGDEVGVLSSNPESTAIDSLGAFLTLGGAGLCISKMPPTTAIVTGEGGFVLAGATPAEIFEAWCLSGQAFEPSVWSAFNFNSFAVHRGQVYAAGEDGIYLLGADHDAGETIQTGARIGPANFSSAGTKRIRSVFFGDGGVSTRVRVKTDEAEGVFAPERDPDRVTVSRDLQASEFIVDILNFEELSHLEIFPLRLARR